MHSELSYGLSFAPKLQRVATIDLSGSHQPTPDPSFSLRHIDSGVLRPELWRRGLAGESPTKLELRGVDEEGGFDRLERRRDHRQDLVAVARGA